ncbi:restriction endonuclease subunit S [Pseudomonas frederiksbergensis]|uniref:restriction endonuclease subunit S n=1 Tax=Pseudomonas frederiksbergensis TaxID=104087 RepID=UPI000F462EF6|nr:restriction endonuclease subunit S [Pseudomonas frederiksbergensis]
MAGKYKAYPEYKNSENSWLGDVPKDWKLIPLKYLSQFSGGGTPSKDNPEYWNGDIPWVSPKDMKTSRIVSTIDSVTEKAIKHSSTNLLKKGALLLVVRSGILQHSIPVAINDVPVTLNQDMKAVRFSSELNAKYAMYLIAGNQAALLLEWRKQGATVESIEQEYLANTTIPVPSIKEQDGIVNFLDSEMAKIDLLIEKQRKLIQLLKEKRQAVISHIVTKGLKKNVKMRDSGIKWLGTVPQSWDVTPLKYLCTFSGGGTPSKENLDYWTDGDIPWVSPKDMKSFWVSDTQDKITERAVAESSTNLIESGALLMVVRSGILQRTIPIAINTVPVSLNQDMKALRFNGRMKAEYAANFILGHESSLLLEWSKEGATVESIEQEYLSSGFIPAPPLEEQIGINKEITERMKLFRNLEDNATRGIALLQERRAALISSVVSGKIDVRNWATSKDCQINKEVAA